MSERHASGIIYTCILYKVHTVHITVYPSSYGLKRKKQKFWKLHWICRIDDSREGANRFVWRCVNPELQAPACIRWFTHLMVRLVPQLMERAS